MSQLFARINSYISTPQRIDRSKLLQVVTRRQQACCNMGVFGCVTWTLSSLLLLRMQTRVI